MSKRLLNLFVSSCFFLSTLSPLPKAYADTVLGLPTPGSMVNLSSTYVPVLIKGLRVHPENPILFDFIIDTGNTGLSSSDLQLKNVSEKLIKYFLATLTIPEDDMWVNLSPYEKNRIIPQQLGQTELGRDMLAEDYVLKQLTASLIYPEKDLGKEFWNRVYAKARDIYGTSSIPVNIFNKVWILPDRAAVFVRNNTAFVVDSHLKVMLEEDYLSLEKHNGIQDTGRVKTNAIDRQIVREVVLPELEKEVNRGKNFATLRQMFYSLILASWYKKNLKEALLNQVYADKHKINGVDLEDKTIKEQIYQEYLKAYKKGVFNYIKEDIDQTTQQPVVHKYFSGGLEWHVTTDQIARLDDPRVETAVEHGPDGSYDMITAGMVRVGNNAMISVPVHALDKKEWVDLLNRNQSKQIFPGLLAVELARIFRNNEFPWIPVVNNTGDKEIVPESGYVFEKTGNEVKLTIYFGDNEDPRLNKEIRTLGYTVNTETNTATIEAPNEEMARQVNRVIDQLLYENVELSDYGYDKRVALQGIIRDIEKAQRENRTELVDEYDQRVAKVFDFLKSRYKKALPKGLTKINVVEVNGEAETYGVYLGKVDSNGAANLYLQGALINRIYQTENELSLDRVAHRFIYALADDSHGQKKIMEAEYIRSVYAPAELTEIIGEDIPAEYQRLMKEQVIGGDEGNPQMAAEIETRFLEYFWEMLVNEFNGEAFSPRDFYFRFNETDRPYDHARPSDRREGGVISWAGAYNPPHWAHIDALYKTMATQKISLGALRTHAIDDRKRQATESTQKDRFDIVDLLAKELPHVKASRMGYGLTRDGEKEFPILLWQVNKGRPGPTVVGYGVGVDHYRTKDAKGRPDTIAKARDWKREKPAASNITSKAFFNLRSTMDLFRETDATEEAMKRELTAEGVIVRLPGQTILGGSSTNIRRALGMGDKRYITLLPRVVYNYIMVHHDYRGRTIGLPLIMRNIAKSAGNYKPEDILYMKNWLRIVRNDGNTHTAAEIQRMFPERIEVNGEMQEPISVQEAQEAINAADKAALVRTPAAVVAEQRNIQGGIDFNVSNMRLNVGGDSIKLRFDPAAVEQFRHGDFSGVRPFIINIVPMDSVMPILGIKEEEETLVAA